MRTSPRKHSPSRAIAACLLAGGALLASCGDKREVREWQPSDHQPPPSVVPEGQGQGESEQVDEATSIARAATTLYQTRCGTCHGATGHGDGPGKPPMAQMPDLTSAEFQRSRTDAQLHEVIKKGRGMMPGFEKELTTAGIDALVKHVRTLASAP